MLAVTAGSAWPATSAGTARAGTHGVAPAPVALADAAQRLRAVMRRRHRRTMRRLAAHRHVRGRAQIALHGEHRHARVRRERRGDLQRGGSATRGIGEGVETWPRHSSGLHPWRARRRCSIAGGPSRPVPQGNVDFALTAPDEPCPIGLTTRPERRCRIRGRRRPVAPSRWRQRCEISIRAAARLLAGMRAGRCRWRLAAQQPITLHGAVQFSDDHPFNKALLRVPGAHRPSITASRSTSSSTATASWGSRRTTSPT